MSRAMVDHLGSVKFDNPADQARAFRAVKRMIDLQPMLSSVVRTITGNPKANVQLTWGTPCTDGTTVWLRPPVELGDDFIHDRALCPHRDDKSHPLCPACARLERVHSVLLHELAHCVFDTFAEVTEFNKVDILNRIIHENQGKLTAARMAGVKKRVAQVQSAQRLNYMGLANMVSPFLPTIVNALEDARVNRAMYEVRAGTYHMFRSKLFYVFEEGQTQINGTVFHWANEDENAQIIIGCLCRASGVEPRDGYLSPAVLTALADPALTAEIDSLEVVATTAADIYGAAFRVLEHFRRLGFCRQPEDEEEPEPEPQAGQGEPDDAEESDDDAASTESEESGDDADEDESASDDVPADNSDESSGESDGDEQSDDDDNGSSDDLEDDGDDSDDEPCDDNDGSDAPGESQTEDVPESGGKPTPGSDEDEQDGEDQDGAGAPGMSGSTDELADDDSGDQAGDAGEPDDGDEDGEVDEEAADERMEATDPDAVKRLVQIFGGHDPDEMPDAKTERQMAVAMIQADQFDEASFTVTQMNTHYFENPDDRACKLAWSCLGTAAQQHDSYNTPSQAIAADYEMPEALVGGTLLKMRTIFAENKKSKQSGQHRSGRVNSQKLPSVMTGNDKVFSRTNRPKRKDYFVCVAMDVSSSTTGRDLHNIKLMGMAIGNLLSRSGVKFALYAHTGSSVGSSADSSHGNGQTVYEGDVFVIKEENDPWDDRAQNRLAKLNASGNNLDGHAMEYFRKRMDRSTATDKVMFYVTDGSMPEANGKDELFVLKRELKECARRRYTVVGVGIGTDSPTTHGLDTIQIDDPKDIAKLVDDLGRRLAVRL